MQTRQLEKRPASVRERETSCPFARVDLCGRLVLEKEKYVNLEDQFNRIILNKEESSIYRGYFSTLLKMVEFSFQFYVMLDILKSELAKISQVKSAYYFQKTNKVSFWIFLDARDWKAENKVYEIYGEMLSTFSNYDITLRILRLWGRDSKELMPSGGTRIIGN
jgi:hypothetical protein